MRELQEAIETTVENPGVRDSLIKSIQHALKTIMESNALQTQAKQVDREREQVEMRMAMADHTASLRERRSQMRKAWFGRESVASIVGAFLLLALGISLIVAMFIGTSPTEVVTSAFLLILGYFFGQTAARARTRRNGTSLPK